MARVLLVSNDRIGRRMAGPGVRYFELSRHLARNHDVTLVVPEPTDVDVPGVEVLEAPGLRGARFVRLARDYDALVAQQLTPRMMWALARTDVKVVYDLYDPAVMETLPHFAERPEAPGSELTYRAVAGTQLVALATGDAFLCASERQRDLWLGVLSALGRIDVASYAADRTLRGLVEIVPFGLDPEPPAPGAPALRGVVPGIAEEDRVLIWGGGIWNWFDPLTVLRAVDLLARERDDVKLYFLGTVRPSANVVSNDMATRAVALAGELGLAGRHVFFNEGWVDYAERGRFLAESDLGVSAHFDDVETRFAFRTRLLDHFWAGLPTVTTGGDVLGELVRERRLGRVAGYEDAHAFAAGIRELLDDEGAYREAQQNLVPVREELAWPRLAERLAEVVASPAAAPPARGTTRRVLGTTFLAFGGSMRQAGARATLELVRDSLWRPRVP